MASITKFSEGLTLGIHSLIVMGSNKDHKYRVNELATMFGASEHHLSKIMQRLTKGDFVKGFRGPKGGYVLSKDISEITLMDVFVLIEGEIDSVGCLLQRQICDGNCFLGPLLNSIQNDFQNYFNKTTIESIVNQMKPNPNL